MVRLRNCNKEGEQSVEVCKRLLVLSGLDVRSMYIQLSADPRAAEACLTYPKIVSNYRIT